MTIRTADLVDAYGDQLQSCSVQFRRFGGRSFFHGPIRTVRCHEDNARLKSVLSEPGHGRVLVVDGGGSLRSALIGDVIGSIAVRQGWAGLVLNGVLRDSVALESLDLGIKALGTNPRKSSKSGAGETDIPVSFGDCNFVPGYWLFSDEDGIVISADAITP